MQKTLLLVKPDGVQRGLVGQIVSRIEQKGLKQVTDSGEIGKLVDEVITNNPDQVQQFKDGKEAVLGYLVGQVMKISQGKANPGKVNELLREKIK